MPEIRPADTDDEIQAFLDLVAVLYPDRALTLEEVRAFEASASSSVAMSTPSMRGLAVPIVR